MLAIKPQPDAKQKPKKDKVRTRAVARPGGSRPRPADACVPQGTNKEEACRLAVEAADALASAPGDLPADEDALAAAPALQRLRELQLPDKVLRRAIAAVLEHALHGAAPPEGAGLPGAACAVVRAVKRAPQADALRALVQHAAPHERLPALLAHAVTQRLLALAELGAWCEGGAHYPLLLLVLQELKALAGMERLTLLYDESKINLCAHVAEHERRDGEAPDDLGALAAPAALDALEARGLAALVPQLRVTAQLARQLQAEPAPHQLYRWIKANVEPPVRHNQAFVSTLVALVARHVTAQAGSADKQPDKAALEREKVLLHIFVHVTAHRFLFIKAPVAGGACVHYYFPPPNFALSYVETGALYH